MDLTLIIYVMLILLGIYIALLLFCPRDAIVMAFGIKNGGYRKEHKNMNHVGKGTHTNDEFDRYFGSYDLLGNRSGGSNSGQKEFEARFLDVDIDELRKKLIDIGAKKIHDQRKLRRCAYDLALTEDPAKKRRGYVRVRDEGDIVTMTVKTYEPGSKHANEYEVSINEDFDDGNKFIDAIGLEKKAYQETYREKWSIGDCNEIAIDTIPGLPTYVEIDCKSEGRVFDVAAKLGFKKEDAHYSAFAKTYEEVYGIDQDIINNHTPILTFETVGEKLGPLVKKNREKFDKTVAAQVAEYVK